MAQKFIEGMKQMQDLPASVRESYERSTIGRGIKSAQGSFLSGITTYMFKVGPGNLGPDADPMDQGITASFPAFVMRLRLQDMARMLADGLAPIATASPHRSLCFINIAGGPAADTWNTLIHLKTEHPELLTDRQVTTTILDLDHQGPSFGSRALETLRAPGAPLSGLNLELRHLTYEWSQTHRLPEILTALNATDAICAISSEGGLFEYGSDEEIRTNLQHLHASTAPDAIIVGSVTRANQLLQGSTGSTGILVRPRTLEAFQSLATQGRWTIQNIIERPMSYNVRLIKS